jgi:DNA-binding MarR family transcriptional regulator
MGMNQDITSNRHGGNEASRVAFIKSEPFHKSQRVRIYEMIAESSGLTSKDIAKKTGWAMHTFSGRITKLKEDGFIRGTGKLEYGCEVLVAVERQSNLWEA